MEALETGDKDMRSIIGMIVLLVLVALPSLAGEGFTFKDETGKHMDVLQDGRIVARFMYAYDKSAPERLHETYKPYLHVFDKEGKAPITKGPGGQYTHHRGIFIGYSRMGHGGKKYDRWHMKGGEQVHQKFLEQKPGAREATLVSQVHWNDGEGKPFVEEERSFTFREPPEGAYVLIDFVSKLKAPSGDVELNGDPEHAGVQYRPAQEVDRKQTVYVFPGEGADPKKDVDYAWVGETYGLNDKHYSVVIMNHPDNPKKTKFSAYRDYGRFGAFPVATIKSGECQVLKFRFLVGEGDMFPAEAIQKCCNAYTGASDPTPKITISASQAKGKKKTK